MVVKSYIRTVAGQTFFRDWLQSFKEFPVRQQPVVFNLERGSN
jgi:hypothetical protein